ncbi:hypothetical protein KKF34_11170 [Myxococcota bacterium]|nr:hypothetical protein [Myxococcota bacterium]MBU1382533.1 hypothetical protein [Myxococcota bacterium]MBU1497425.1 hypothetical protein [Myxococcota bacterium]
MDEHFPAGIDEAGRGCLIGPMFMVCLVVKNHSVFNKIKLADSKKYGSSEKARKQRASVFAQLANCCSIFSVEVPARIIDREVLQGEGLNALERKCASHLLSTGSSGVRTIADGVSIFRPLTELYANLAVENKADQTHRAVMAASVCAKHFRDQWVDTYFRQMETVVGYHADGGGYVNKKTLQFIEDYQKIMEAKPPHIRDSWKLKA